MIQPRRVKTIPVDSENGCGCLSANLPTNGCRIEDVIWNTSVIMPICPNVKPYLSFITGYIDGMIDCTISLSKWAMLIIKRIDSMVFSLVAVSGMSGLIWRVRV